MDEGARATFNNPLDRSTVDRALALIETDAKGAVLDVGCGKGEMLALAMERHSCQGVGVDPNEEEIAVARRRLGPFRARATLHAQRIQDVPLEPASFDAALCVGATHAFGTGREAYPAALAALTGLVRRGGLLLVGEGFWRRDPEPAYLEATGMGADSLRTHAENVALGEQQGLVPWMAVASSDTAWDLFESAYWAAAEKRLRGHPEDPEAVAQAARVRKWRDAYLRWGRSTMGFAMYAFRLPG